MSFIENPNGKNFKYGILLKEKNIFLDKNYNLLSGEDLQKILTEFKKQDIEDIYGEPETFTFAVYLCNSALIPCGLTEISIREFFSIKNAVECFTASRALSIMKWRKNVKFCSTCGSLLKESNETARYCTRCKKQIFPQIEPCIIVLVNKNEKILLARHVKRNTDIYTCLAGFIEAGESAEEAVAREIKEETGISVKNIRYCASQSWPYPDQLMLAFTAEYSSGEINIRKDEISEAQWFSKDNLPPHPSKGSLAYRMIYGEFN